MYLLQIILVEGMGEGWWLIWMQPQKAKNIVCDAQRDDMLVVIILFRRVDSWKRTSVQEGGARIGGWSLFVG